MPSKPNKLRFTDADAERAFPEVPLPDADSKNYPKRTPQRQIFNSVQDAWIQMQTSQFHAILDDTQCNACDRDEQEVMFKRAKILQFKRKFPESERPDAYIRKITQIFANLKSRSKFGSSGPSDDAPPFPSYMLVSGKAGASSGYSLFAEKNRETINNEVLEHRRINNIGNQQHPALLWTFSSRAWARLTPDEQGQYVAEATVMKRERGAPDDIYQNQIETMAFLQCILQRVIGHGPGQIGNASFHVFMAYQDSNDCIEPFIVHAGPSFGEFLGKEESKDLEDRWIQFAERNILPNHPVLQEREFERNEAGCYLLIASETFSTSNGGGHNAYLQYLKRFLDATGALDFARSSKLPNMPWELITQALGDYLHPDLYDGKSLAKLNTSHARLYSFADSIVQFQSMHPMDSIFSPYTASIAASSLDLPTNFTSPTNPCTRHSIPSSPLPLAITLLNPSASSSLETTNVSSPLPLGSTSLKSTSPAVNPPFSVAVVESPHLTSNASLGMMLSLPLPSQFPSPTDYIETFIDPVGSHEPSVSTTTVGGAGDCRQPEEMFPNSMVTLPADSTSEPVGSSRCSSEPTVAAKHSRTRRRSRFINRTGNTQPPIYKSCP